MAPLVVPGCQQVLFACDTINCLCTACASRKLIQPYLIKHSPDSLLCISPPAGFQHFCQSVWCHCWCYRIFANTSFLEVYCFQLKSPKTIILWPHRACYCLMYSIFFDFLTHQLSFILKLSRWGCRTSFVFNGPSIAFSLNWHITLFWINLKEHPHWAVSPYSVSLTFLFNKWSKCPHASTPSARLMSHSKQWCREKKYFKKVLFHHLASPYQQQLI